MTDVKKEALRYLGCRGEPDEQTERLLQRGIGELDRSVSPAFCFLVRNKAECAELLCGNDIQKHLADCESVIFFAATLGAGADRLIRAAEIEDMAYAVVLDALASARIEQYCDQCEEEMKKKTGGNYTWRFSPGYGDFPIALQSNWIRLLSADKRIGLTATENHILIPRKSVTAVIGISPEKKKERADPCAICGLREQCGFRKDGLSCGR